MRVSCVSFALAILVSNAHGKFSVTAESEATVDDATNSQRKLHVDVNDPSYDDADPYEPSKDDYVKGDKGTYFNSASTETESEKYARLSGTIPPGAIEQEFSPLRYATCFNEAYETDFDSINQYELYKDYGRIFNWGFRNEMGPPLEGVSEANLPLSRLPGMFLRMCFHDNSINIEQPKFQDYINNYVDYDERGWGRWTGPAEYLATSGADASNLLCTQERFHPNQNLEGTASRVLYSLQSKDIPDIYDYNGKKTNMVEKYGLSYADMLHNGCVAAAIYARPKVDWSGAPKDEMKDLAKFPFKFGRKDACRYRWKEDHRSALCGPTELLPGLALTTKQTNDWFINRGMNPCQFMALMWTHTMMGPVSEDVSNICPLMKLPCSTTSGFKLDYFSAYLQPGEHIVSTPEEILATPDGPNCKWTPSECAGERPWPMTAVDCSLSLDVAERSVDKHPADDNLRELKDVIKDFHSTAIPPEKVLECSLRMLGGYGNEKDCDDVQATCTKIGTNVVPHSHLFGGYYGKPAY